MGDQKGFLKKVAFEQSPEGGNGGRHADIWRKSVQATETAGAKALGRSTAARVEEQEGRMAGAGQERGKAEVREADWEVMQTRGGL